MKLALLTSGGDAPGMNPAVRAVVHAAHTAGATVIAVREGYEGLVHGWAGPIGPTDVGGLLDQGGTILGTARSAAFRAPSGRRAAVATLLAHECDGLIVIGGEGSLTGASILSTEWPEHVAALVQDGRVDPSTSSAHPPLRIVGLVGSIDNDSWGTATQNCADSAPPRVIEAPDALALSSTNNSPPTTPN